MNKRNIIIIVSILAFIVIIGGISYSYFVYNKDIGSVTLNTGDISIDFSNTNGNKTLTNVIPMSDIDGKSSSDYFDFTVNSTVDSEKIYYEVYILPKSGNTLDTSYLKTYLTDQNNVEIKGVRLYDDLSTSEKEANGKVIYKGLVELNNDYSTKNESKEFRLRMWLDENYAEQTSKTFEFDIYLYAKNVEEDFEIRDGDVLLRKAILAKEADTNVQCSNITYEEDGITYLSGTNNCIDMNYVWYSGKLWRITAIYPDGAMKLITENNITTIAFNSSGQVNFYTDANTTSYMYQWLNEDFYDTLYNPSNIIDATKQWNATSTNESGVSTKLSETTMVTANVGLLNSYEYYNSLRDLDSNSNSYLYINYNWRLLNPYNSWSTWTVCTNQNNTACTKSSTYEVGVRPSIIIKSGLEFIGNGTISSPYNIVGDKNTGLTNEYINTRLSGEYVKLVNSNNNEQYQLFRIIGVEDNKTKIIAMDYAYNGATNKFASTWTGVESAIWGSGSTGGTWYSTLNYATTGYFDTLRSTYGELFDSALYYLGSTGDGGSYKLSVCANTTSGNTKVCDKTSDVGTFNIGLPRNGEMFATQQAGGYDNSNSMWLISRHTLSLVDVVTEYGTGAFSSPEGNRYCARPTVHLKSTVKILSGSGTETDPYVVGL